MTLLVCAATEMELKAFEERPGRLSDERGVNMLVTGVGIPATLARLLPLAQAQRPALILNIGIAGAYPSSGLAIGDIVMGESEVYGDLGFELPEEPGFQSLSTSPFAGDLYRTPFPLLQAPAYQHAPNGYGFRIARGCTVNACAGTDRTGRLRETLFQAQFESMEGAAVAQVGQQESIPVCEIRAISNIAARRDMRPENIGRALANLRDYLAYK